MELTQKGEVVSRLQAKAGQIGKILSNLEKFNHLAQEKKRTPTSDKPKPFLPLKAADKSPVTPTPAPRNNPNLQLPLKAQDLSTQE